MITATLCHCGNPALRTVGPIGFCREHFSEAQAKQAQVIRDLDSCEGERAREIRRHITVGEPHQ